MKPKTYHKLEQIARLRLFSGMTDVAVATLVGLTPSGLSRIIALPEFRDIEQRLAVGDLQEMDKALAGRTQQMREVFAPAVPAAMRALQEAVLQRRDLKTAVSAAIQILDRDPNGTFATSSKATASQSVLPGNVLKDAAAMAATIPTRSAVVIQPADKNVN